MDSQVYNETGMVYQAAVDLLGYHDQHTSDYYEAMHFMAMEIEDRETERLLDEDCAAVYRKGNNTFFGRW